MTQQKIAYIGEMKVGEFGDRLLEIAFRLAAQAQIAIDEAIEHGYQVITKDGYDGKPGAAIALNIDHAIQAMFLELAKEFLPARVGFFGEENNLRVPSRLLGPKVTVTVDPIDGTERLRKRLEQKRKPLPGEVSVMLGILVDGVAVGGVICDVATLEAYIRFPYGENVWRIIGPSGLYESGSSLPCAEFHEGALLWHGIRSPGSTITKHLIKSGFDETGQIEHVFGSIGLCASRVLGDPKVVALLRPSGTHNTAWDDASIQAFSDIDLVTFEVTEDAFVETIVPLGEPVKRPNDLLYIPRYYLGDLAQFGTVQLLS